MTMTHVKNKTCPKCKLEKDVSEFYKYARGYSAYCKDCLKEASHQRVLDGRDRQSKIKYEIKNGHSRMESKRDLQTPIERIAGALYHNAKKRSTYLNKPFDITREYVDAIVSEFCRNNYCVLSDAKNPFKPSLDRKDNSLGYTEENTIVCWQIENYCKNTFTENDVIEFCKRKLNLI